MMSMAPRGSKTPRRAWPFVVLAALCIFPVLVMAGVQYMDGRENVSYRCAVDQELPAGAVISESNHVSSSVTAFPAGRLCVFKAVDGGTVAVQTGWPTTLIGLAATIAAIVLTVIAVRRLRGGKRIAALVPTAVIVLLWIVVILSAHTIDSTPTSNGLLLPGL